MRQRVLVRRPTTWVNTLSRIQTSIKRFLHIYDGARDEFDGHIIEGLEIDGKKHDIEIPAGTMAQAFAQIMSQEHPVFFHQMLRKDYRLRERPNQIGKFVPKSAVYYNAMATAFGYNRLGQSLSYHGCDLMKKNQIQSRDDGRPSCLDTVYCKDMIDKMAREVHVNVKSKSKNKECSR